MMLSTTRPMLAAMLAIACGAGCGASAATTANGGTARNDIPPPAVDPGPVSATSTTASTTTSSPAATDAYLREQMTLRAGQFAENMTSSGAPISGTLATGARQDFQIALDAGRCFKVIGVAEQQVEDFDLYMFDAANTPIQQDTATDNFPVLGLQAPICPTVATTYRVQAHMYAGRGAFVIQTFVGDASMARAAPPQTGPDTPTVAN